MYFPFQFDPERMAYRRLTEGWLPYEPFWDRLGSRGIQTVLLDMSMMPVHSRQDREPTANTAPQLHCERAHTVRPHTSSDGPN